MGESNPGSASSGDASTGRSTSPVTVSGSSSDDIKNSPQGEAIRYRDQEVRAAIDKTVLNQRVKFVSIQRGKLVFSSVDQLDDEQVQSRLLSVLSALKIVRSESPQIRQAMEDTDGIALLAT